MSYSFPAVSPFLELTNRSKQNPSKIIIRDHSAGVSATAGELLNSVASFREKLLAKVHENKHHQNGVRQNGETQNGELQNGERQNGESIKEKFIFLIAPPGYEYVVSMLTIFSLGAAMSAQSIVVRPEDIQRYLKLANPIALVYAPALAKKAEAIQALVLENNSGINPELVFQQIDTSTAGSSFTTFEVDESVPAPPTGSLFFTSGTSGNPKGVVHSYQALLASARERIGTWKLTESDAVLNQKPGNWMGGIFGIIPTLISGATLETCAGVFDPVFFWERVSQGGVSVFDVAPTGYDRLAQYFEEHIATLPTEKRDTYLDGIIAVRVAGVSGSLLQPHTQKKWTALRRGKPLLNLYGSTETLLMCSMRWENPVYEDMTSIGPPVSGVEVKLVDGEMRIKAPSMFSRYISEDPTLTAKAFDEEGFFKTGDFAEKIGDSYTLHGRANIDVLHFWGITLHTNEIERALFSLPYISDAVVLPLEDGGYKERAAAILKYKGASKSKHPDLITLRKDLTDQTGLMEFKQPTVVYWLQEGEEISLTANGKISKLEARKRFFGDAWPSNKKVEILDLSGLEYWRFGGQC